MVLESRYPLQNNPLLYDKYLEQGFFRGSSIMYKIKLLCIGNRLSSVINIRLPLYNFEIKKWQKKLITKNTQHFKFTITPFRYSEQLEILYQNQKRKFKGFLYPTLVDFLNSGFTKTRVFNTQVISVFDGDKLIAASLFDLGSKSAAGLLGLYNQQYAKYSLGMFTMLLEVLFCKESGFQYYYPGYVLSNNTEFNYKLRLGKMEWLDWNNGWVADNNFVHTHFPAQLIEQKIADANETLLKFNIISKKRYYPNFTLAYVFEHVTLIKTPVYLEIENLLATDPIFLTYDFESNNYQLLQVKTCDQFPDWRSQDISSDYKESTLLDLEVKEILNNLKSNNSLTPIIDNIQKIKSKYKPLNNNL